MADVLCQILEQHIRMVFPALKTDLNSKMDTVLKELQTYGKPIESKVSCNTKTSWCSLVLLMHMGTKGTPVLCIWSACCISSNHSLSKSNSHLCHHFFLELL